MNAEAVALGCFVKEVFLEISQNSRKTPVPESLSFCNFIKKETLAQVFSCEFCEISKNTFSYGTPPVAASVNERLTFLILFSKYLIAKD